ncbi:DUF3616 domain-containing protein [Methylobacterium tardum]|uniref:DUF3616 domain-containing protein n=1 Tax=Methylobacterium tardum TaxID=374432 RepID=UPI001EDEDCEC|nr:DUF3616 domain-containing protein [Methylobacterium tardum]URD35159.1 DUF3616 domain-containing protein [Methylobacterium tardum]
MTLDYRHADKAHHLVRSLSGVSFDGVCLWTVSDEGRTLERLAADEQGFVFERQFVLDTLFPDLPSDKEADLEGLDAEDGRVWLCGSHARTRAKLAPDGRPSPDIRRRPSRHLLGSVVATEAADPAAYALPFTDAGSLRSRLRDDPLLADFANLPSKENGLDIEGLAVLGSRLLLGLRGPVVAGLAVAVELRLRSDGRIANTAPIRHLLNLGGLGIRDLTRFGEDVLVLAGPVTGADGPFRIYTWRPVRTKAPQEPKPTWAWLSAEEHPEGFCWLERGDRFGLLVVYDSPDERRIEGHRYTADWFDLTP